jgi:hypothetical protein
MDVYIFQIKFVARDMIKKNTYEQGYQNSIPGSELLLNQNNSLNIKYT